MAPARLQLLMVLRRGRVSLLFASRGLVSARRSNDAVRVGPSENFGDCLPLCFVRFLRDGMDSPVSYIW
jgi:hypothetical protein